MPINDLVKQHAFAPDEINLLVAAFEEALQELQLKDRSDPAVMLVAKRMVEVASQGEAAPRGVGRLRMPSLRPSDERCDPS
jgi:hypothetical protein